MIHPDASLHIEIIPLDMIQVKEWKERTIEQVCAYVTMLKERPGWWLGLLDVVASPTHPGLYELEDGHHRLCAYIIGGYSCALCVVRERKIG